MHRAGKMSCSEVGIQRFRVKTAEARLSRFGINPLWLTSTVEIKAVICQRWLNNVRPNVKHTPAALYIMHQRPAEGLLRKDNMTYPWERGRGGRGREGRQAGKHSERLERDRGGNERVSNEDLTRVFHPQYVVDEGRMVEEATTPKAPEGCSHKSH